MVTSFCGMPMEGAMMISEAEEDDDDDGDGSRCAFCWWWPPLPVPAGWIMMLQGSAWCGDSWWWTGCEASVPSENMNGNSVVTVLVNGARFHTAFTK